VEVRQIEIVGASENVSRFIFSPEPESSPEILSVRSQVYALSEKQRRATDSIKRENDERKFHQRVCKKIHFS
jgi:hypothetical protein